MSFLLVNVTCQPGWAADPRIRSKTRLDVTVEVFFLFLFLCFQMRLTFKSVDSEQSRAPSGAWVGRVQSGDGLTNEKGPGGRGNSASSGSWGLSCDVSPSWISPGLSVHPAGFGLSVAALLQLNEPVP